MPSSKGKSSDVKGDLPPRARKVAPVAPTLVAEQAIDTVEPPFMPTAAPAAAAPVEAATGVAIAMAEALPPPAALPEPVAEITEPVAETAAQTLSSTIAQGTKTMTDLNQNFETAQQQTSDRFQAAFGDMNQRAKAAVEKSSKLFEETSELAKGNVEALVASSKIAAKGVESLGQGAADYGRRSFEEASAVLKSFAEVKSPTELFKLQSDYARSAFDAMVAESSKVSETMIKLAGEVVEPLTSRYTVAVEKVKTLAA